MRKIYVLNQYCNGCGECKKACLYDAILLKNGNAIIDRTKCTLCGACLKFCKNRSIIITKKNKDIITKHRNEVWVFIEVIDGKVNSSCLQILSKAFELAKETGNKLVALIVGKEIKRIGYLNKLLSNYGIDKLKILESENIKNCFAEDIAELIYYEITSEMPDIILFSGTFFGRELAPRLAVKVRTGITADCTDLYIDKNKNLVQVRPTYGGKLLAKIICKTKPQIATVRPNIFEIKLNKSNTIPEIDRKKINIVSVESLKKIVDIFQIKSKNNPIDEEKIIICGGFGMGSKKNFDKLLILANKLGGAVGGTRAAVDAGWIDFSAQIGQTGKIIKPNLYIGFGVSGAIHHLIGIKNSKKIIAINIDPRAPIFKIADYGIIADANEILLELIKAV